ncbi:MAG: preprotein translocase subunit SecG [Planctomycetota bacterium]|jgi:preprotein translocase subunit SecG
MDIFLGTLFVVICILLIIVVLLQKGRGGGLAAAFGGAGSSAFGTRTGDVFTWVTIVLTALFLILAIGANFAFRPEVLQVDRPTFDPRPGAIPGPTEVAIGCTTPGADVRFTTDGSEPTKDSERYNAPFEVTPGMTVKARAFVERMEDSEIASAYYSQAPLPEIQPETQPAEEPEPETQPAEEPEPETQPAEEPEPETQPAEEPGPETQPATEPAATLPAS